MKKFWASGLIVLVLWVIFASAPVKADVEPVATPQSSADWK